MVGLWGIVNILYFLLITSGYSSNLELLRVIPVPRAVFLPALALWAAGFVVLMGRHELTHIASKDSELKLFMVFCRSLF